VEIFYRIGARRAEIAQPVLPVSGRF